jgi:aminotransferase in exopolysaccharide biosynthesis
MVNGTEALHLALLASGVRVDDEVITQTLSFAATPVAIVHTGANPVFIDVDKETLGMSPESLRAFLKNKTVSKNGSCVDTSTGKIIRTVVPMHTFGHPCRIDAIKEICDEYGLILIEDAAESLGSFYKGKHTGTFGKAAILSFNGNKTVTTGGGGMVITNDDAIAEHIRYISTTAKRPHKWEFYHTEAGYNLRLPGVNAAIGKAQLECLDDILANKRETAKRYKEYFDSIGIPFIIEPENCRSNYWLNAIMFNNRADRDEFLEYSNNNGVQTRPAWNLLHTLPPYEHCQKTETPNAEYIADRLVNIPSGYRKHLL